MAAPVRELSADLAHRPAVGLGEVPGQQLDGAGQHQPDDHGADRQPLRAAAVRQDGAVGDPGQLAEVGGQVGKRGHRDQDRGDHRRYEEPAVDRGHAAAVALARRDHEDADDGGDHADHRDDQREDQAVVPERHLAQDQRRHQHDRVRLEQVSGHARAVAHVVAHVVGDRGRVPRVVLGDVLLDLADQVGADVRGLGEDAAADTHEHREQRGAEAEALEHLGRVALVDKNHERRAEQAKADGEHPGHPAGAEGDAHRLPLAALLRRGGHAHVPADSQRHARETGQGREQGTDQEENATSPAHARRVGRQQQEHEEDQDHEHAQRPELAFQVGRGAFLDGSRDLLHLLGALAGRQNLPYQHASHHERQQRHHRDDDHPGEVGAVQGNPRGRSEVVPNHPSSLTWARGVPRRGRAGRGSHRAPERALTRQAPVVPLGSGGSLRRHEPAW